VTPFRSKPIFLGFLLVGSYLKPGDSEQDVIIINSSTNLKNILLLLYIIL